MVRKERNVNDIHRLLVEDSISDDAGLISNSNISFYKNLSSFISQDQISAAVFNYIHHIVS